jgi:diaminohydroxyphosphoribosylaminopyrimidine deaminase / 5-amino-6-(5-phosphoribosylamino)uracil reductase
VSVMQSKQIHDDHRWMTRALSLAGRGGRSVQPNPLVGAVLVKDGRVIGEGWHTRAGAPHAEREALAACCEDPTGATIYVTLEPCHLEGRTPPCTEAILEAGISRVVYALEDPNPAERGISHKLLATAGLTVEGGLLGDRASAQNEIYLHHQQTGRPWVLLKSAITINGMVARADGGSRWITGEPARRLVHAMRGGVGAIGIGAETLRQDDPRLDLRLIDDGRPPPRPVIFAGDPRKCPPDHRWEGRDPILLLPEEAISGGEPHRENGWQVLPVPGGETGQLDLAGALAVLAKEEISSIMIEGGGRLTTAFLKADLWERWELFMAPRLFPADGRSVWRAPGERGEMVIDKVAMAGDDIQLSLMPNRGGDRA